MIDKVQNILTDKEIDGLLITDENNIFYLTGFKSSSAMMLISENKSYLFTDSRYEIAANNIKIPNLKIKINESIFSLINDLKISKLGFENLSIKYYLYEILKKHNNIFKLIGIDNAILKIRSIKTDSEIDRIKEAYKISEKAFKNIYFNGSEKDIAASINYSMILHGAEKEAFDTIVSFKENSAIPHHYPGDIKVKGNGFLKIDFGAKYKGYNSDTTRTLFLGTPSTKEKDIYKTVLEAHELALDEVKEGVTFKSIEDKVRKYIDKKYENTFTHSLGHGLGIEVHEYPSFDEVLKENMVITIEPGIYIKGLGGVRIEDGIIITKNGYKRLNNLPKEELLEI